MTAPSITHSELLDPKGRAHTLALTTHEKPGDVEGVDPFAAWELTACRMIGRYLHAHYQGHDWAVNVDKRAGVAKIWLNGLQNPTQPYVLHLENLEQSTVMRAGGELLERFGLNRSVIDFAQAREIKAKRGPLSDRMATPGGLGKIG